MEYEINFLVLQSNTEDLENIKENLKKLLEKRGAEITDTLEYKKRKLAYKIKHEQYGFFTVLRFKIEDGEMIKEIKKDLNLLQTVARYIIIKADELPSLKEETPEKQEEAEMASKNTVKQEEVDKMLSEKKTTKNTDKEESPEKEEEVKEEQAKEKEEKAEEKVEEIKEEIKPEEKVEEKIEEPKEEAGEKKEEVAEEKVAEEKKEKETEKKDDRSSLEDLDKKLDEILNG